MRRIDLKKTINELIEDLMPTCGFGNIETKWYRMGIQKRYAVSSVFEGCLVTMVVLKERKVRKQ